MNDHMASTNHVNDLFDRLAEFAADPDPDAHDADAVSPTSVARAGQLLHRISTASICQNLNRRSVANVELYPSRDGGILIVVPMSADREYEFMIDPDGEIDLGVAMVDKSTNSRTIDDRGTIALDHVVQALKSA